MVTARLTSDEAAQMLGIRRATLYSWLRMSDAGELVFRSQPVTIRYLQGGRAGQGRILIESSEVERLLSLMQVTPRPSRVRQSPTKLQDYRYITTRPGRPDD